MRDLFCSSRVCFSDPVVKKGRGRPAKIYRLRDAEGNVLGSEGEVFSHQALLPLNMSQSLKENIFQTDQGTSDQVNEVTPKGVVMTDPLSGDGIVPAKTNTKEARSENAERKDEPAVEVMTEAQKENNKPDILELVSDPMTQNAVTGNDPMLAGPQQAPTSEEMGLVSVSTEPHSREGQELMRADVNKDMIPDLPVFTSEEEKLAFEETLNQIDMTQVGYVSC